jgi:FlaA1/EpsC-like NDP-sugar epimerase
MVKAVSGGGPELGPKRSDDAVDPSTETEEEWGRSRRFASRASRVWSKLLFVFLDVFCVAGGYSAAAIVYFRQKAPTDYGRQFVTFVAAVIVLTLFTNQVFGLYGRMWRHAGVEEARQLMLATTVVGIILVATNPAGRALRIEPVPLGVIVIGMCFAAMGMGVLRFHSRLFAWQRGSRRMGLRVGIVGSRDTGASAIREMLRCPGAGLVPVAVFDDDTSAHGLSLMGVPVVGSIDDIAVAASRYTLQQILLAIPSPTPELVTRVLDAAEQAGVTMKVLPTVHDILSGPAHMAAIQQARGPRIEDLLGRTPVATDLDEVRRSLEGHRVLVTGAGGSIGSEFCRQVSEMSPDLLVLLDHDETHLHDTAAAITEKCEQALVDVVDREAVFEAFARYRPDVVFHAAAHKHVPVLEAHPIEAAKTNVFGTLNVVEASVAFGVTRFVQISTDKAVRPSSVMGASKRLAEQVVLAHSPRGAAYCAVRFGNVLGSRGSVIPTFARQIEAGGPVTVTNPHMTRFFMSVEEAVQLVLQASVLSEGGDIFMLEMGAPIRIIDLARRMIELSGFHVGSDISIEIVGSRPGEKLQEELSSPEEIVLATDHPSIQRLVPISSPVDIFTSDMQRLVEAIANRDSPTVRELLFEAAPLSGEMSRAASPVATNGAPIRPRYVTADPDAAVREPDSGADMLAGTRE